MYTFDESLVRCFNSGRMFYVYNTAQLITLVSVSYLLFIMGTDSLDLPFLSMFQIYTWFTLWNGGSQRWLHHDHWIESEPVLMRSSVTATWQSDRINRECNVWKINIQIGYVLNTFLKKILEKELCELWHLDPDVVLLSSHIHPKSSLLALLLCSWHFSWCVCSCGHQKKQQRTWFIVFHVI